MVGRRREIVAIGDFGDDAAHRFHEFRTGDHHGMTATAAANAKVRADAQDFPFLTAAGMRFFHGDDIADIYF